MADDVVSPGDRIIQAAALFDTHRAELVAKIRAEQPGISTADLRVEVFEREYGAEFSAEERARIIAGIRRAAERS